MLMVSRYFDHCLSLQLAIPNLVSKLGPIVCLTLSLFTFNQQEALSHQTKQAPRPVLQWHEWGQEAFILAQAEDKLILLDLTAVWCHACHVMDQTTYADPKVIDLIHSNVIAIRVDTDQRPDLEVRYRSGGWPTTSLLLPTGEILFQANSLDPEAMATLLQEAKVLYESEKEDLREQAADLWNRVKSRMRPKASSIGIIRPSMAEHSVDMMKNEFDPENGGFRDHPKFFEPEAIQMALAYGFFEQDAELINMGLTTLEKQVALLDPVWGGFYRYAEQADWSEPHFEKMLAIQAQNLRNYISAFQLTGNTEFKHIAWRIIDFVERFLTDPRTGQFLESQDADVRDQEGMTLLSGKDFFSLGMVHRKAQGMPTVDYRIFTGSNADMVRAYLLAAEVLENLKLQERAIHVLTKLVKERWNTIEGVAHDGGGGAVTLYGLLSDHIRLGLALMAAFGTTNDGWFLEQAKTLAETTQSLLEDDNGHGFFDRPFSTDDVGLLNMPTKPARENLQAVRWYIELFHLTGKDEYRSTAQRTLQSVVGTPQPLPIALIGLAVDEWFRTPVHIAIVGRSGNEETRALWQEARQLYCPRKIVKHFDPQQDEMKWGEISFPYDGRPSVFMCTDQMCLPPVYQREMMKERLNELLSELREAVP